MVEKTNQDPFLIDNHAPNYRRQDLQCCITCNHFYHDDDNGTPWCYRCRRWKWLMTVPTGICSEYTPAK